MNDYSVLQLDEVLHSVAKYCAFSLGKERILDLKPFREKLLIERELNRTSEAISLVVSYGSIPLGGITDISESLYASMKDYTLGSMELLTIARFAYSCDDIVSYFRQSSKETPELKDLVNSLAYSIPLSQEITRCIDEVGEVKDNASAKLKSLKKNLVSLEAKLRSEAERYTRINAAMLSEQVTTLRNDRFVVLAKASAKNQVGGFIHGESNSGQTLYVEPEVLFNLNNERATLLSNIEEEIHRILTELSIRVKHQANDYLKDLVTISLIDSINAKAMWAKEYDAVCAVLGGELKIEYARHPLIDRKQVIANSYHIYNDKKMLLITGPNTGGKTVSLKIIALFTLMTYCGLALPCEEAMIPLYDEIYLDIGDQQSILESLSTFSGHMKRLVDICEQCTENSLVILDELCGGTDPKEGEALAIAILDYLREKNCTCCVTTHYSRLKTYAKKYPQILEASVEFDKEELKPTYRYLEGITGQSNALEIAKRLGLKSDIIDRASQLKTSYQTKEESLLETLEASITQNRLKEDELKAMRKTLAEQQKKLDKEISLYIDKKEELLAQARKEAENYLNEVQEEANGLLKEMRNKDQIHEAISVKHDIDQLKIVDTKKEESEQQHDFAVSDYVQIKNSNQKGVIESMDKKKIIVNCNGLKITAKADNLIYLGKKPRQNKEKTRVKYVRPDSMSLELNLIGERVSDALPILDKYLDTAVLMKAPYVRIIHGYGTGTLRKAIWDHLKNNKYIESMRLGQEGEGSSGATVITFKKK